ncbi:MAG: L,D-transpeptidase [Pseudomonadota bacterium]|nr:L,D-transpeptidase [Pseudomonadota bacterium]
MKMFRFSRTLTLGVALSLLLPAAADAQLFRMFDPVTQGFVTYDTEQLQPRGRQAMPDPQYQAQVVQFATAEAPGTIVIDTGAKFLYYVMKDGLAIRYGVGVGKEGFGWSGVVTVGRKAEWPTWTPPAEMIERRPELVEYVSGMPGGPENPLGARALYLYDGAQDTMFRIHGTNEPWSIGHNVSSGCIRMLNEHVTELHRMATVGTKVIVQ